MVIRTEDGLKIVSGVSGVGKSRLFDKVEETKTELNTILPGGGEINMNTTLTTKVATEESVSAIEWTEGHIALNIAPQKVRGFEIVSKYADQLDESFIPERGTEDSGGYDLKCAEDTVVPSLFKRFFDMQERLCDEVENEIMTEDEYDNLFEKAHTIEETAELLKKYGLKPTLVPTGVKAYFPKHQTGDLQARSGMPLKTLLIVANAPGLIDSDYYNNPKNEGHIFAQFINLSPFDILIKKGEKMAQLVIRDYHTTDNDKASGKRQGGHGSTGLK